MNTLLKILAKRLISLTLVVSCSALAATKEIDDAVNRYYAGFPREAIGMLEPLARSGDADAQYLLGNILYSLSEKGKNSLVDESISWYKMAAEQNSADANYAIGVIFQNKWLGSRNRTDAATAIVYYQNAVDLGHSKAQSQLTRIISRSGISRQVAAAIVTAQKVMHATKSVSGVETPGEEKAETGSGKKPIMEEGATGINIAKTSDVVSGTETLSENSARTAQLADNPDARFTITLDDIATQCQNYTETGFTYYAETIRGALFSGIASMVAKNPDASQPGAFTIDLANRQFDSAVFVNLRKVPKEVARTFTEGDKHAVSGIVVDSKVVGSDCALSIIYQPIEG